MIFAAEIPPGGSAIPRERSNASLPISSAIRPTLWLVLSLLCSRPATPQQAVSPPPSPVSTPAARASSQPPIVPLFRIVGTVVDSLTKSPVPGAELTLVPMGTRRSTGLSTRRRSQQQPEQTVTAVADTAGRFTIEAPSAGGWSLTAAAHGYHSQAFDEHDGYSTAIVLTEANPSFDLTFALPPASAIEGYVLDDAGEPVRNGRLTLSLVPPATPEDPHPHGQVRANQHTDDRGYYRFSSLLAGDYEVRLQAQPWYATTGGAQFRRVAGDGVGSGIGGVSAFADPSSAPAPLDVVYPILWYPGVADFSAATPLTLRPGEAREADFRLSPIPGFHLRIAAAAAPAEDSARPAIQNNASLSQVLPDGSEAPVAMSAQTDESGNMEFSGLAPGTYIVHRPGEWIGTGDSAATIRISPDSARSVDLSQATAATPVTVKIDPPADIPSLQVIFRDLSTGRISFLRNPQTFGFQGPRGGLVAIPPVSKDPSPAARSIDLEPDRYEVSLAGIGDLHLTGIEATGATATGRTVTIGGGSPSLSLHVAAGRANIAGFVHIRGAPDAGAMVLLVPATLGDPAGLCITRRDQSNTDGSFDILNVLPGAYILVAIDHGWDLNWRDPATLRGFLTHGLPLDLTGAGDRRESVEAQSP